jgi:hypothetical protein
VKQLTWYTRACVRMTNSLAGIGCAHAAHVPLEPNILM